MKTSVIAPALLLACSCSILPGSGTELPREQPVTRVSGGEVVNAEDTGEKKSEAWREARGSILRTFAFRALEKELVDEAREYLSEACEVNPSDTASHAALARLYLSEGDAESALIYAERASAAAPQDPEVSMVYAAALAENDQEEKATEMLEAAWTAVENDPRFARALLTHYAAMGQTQEAKGFVERMMTEDPGHATSWVVAGDLLLSEGDVDAAAESYRRAIELDPETSTPSAVEHLVGRGDASEDPLVTAARASEERGEFAEAENLYRYLVKARPLDPQARLGLARALYQRERFDRADVVLAQVAHGERGWRGHLLQAKLDIHFERWTAARTSLNQATQSRPDLRAASLLLRYVEDRIAEEKAREKDSEEEL